MSILSGIAGPSVGALKPGEGSLLGKLLPLFSGLTIVTYPMKTVIMHIREVGDVERLLFEKPQGIG